MPLMPSIAICQSAVCSFIRPCLTRDLACNAICQLTNRCDGHALRLECCVCCAGKRSLRSTTTITSKRERKPLTLAQKMRSFPEVLAAWDARAAAGAAVTAAQTAKAAATTKVRTAMMHPSPVELDPSDHCCQRSLRCS